jgi:peptide-methionine (S)-S-oxide reductase
VIKDYHRKARRVDVRPSGTFRSWYTLFIKHPSRVRFLPGDKAMKRYVAAVGILILSLLSLPCGAAPRTEVATFAGGCFWCEEEVFDSVPGVASVLPGYTGGHRKNPTYEEVSAGGTGHAESVQVVYDPSKVSYGRLLELFWYNVDPTVKDAQFCDHGNQYRSAIFYHTEAQKRAALESKAALEKTKPFKGAIVTEIVPASAFYPAEEYHRAYHRKNPIRYKFYRTGCGRDARLRELWGALAGK